MRVLTLTALFLLTGCNTPAQAPLPYGPDDKAHRQERATRKTTPAQPAAKKGATLTGRAVHIVDGDTFDLLTPEAEKVRVRMGGIDAPEKAQDFGQVAKEGLGGLLQGASLRVVITDRDRYGRSVCDVWAHRASGGEVWVNEAMVRRGWAWHYTAYSKDPALAAAQTEATRAMAGLWGQQGAVAPWEWRKKKKLKMKN